MNVTLRLFVLYCWEAAFQPMIKTTMMMMMILPYTGTEKVEPSFFYSIQAQSHRMTESTNFTKGLNIIKKGMQHTGSVVVKQFLFALNVDFPWFESLSRQLLLHYYFCYQMPSHITVTSALNKLKY